MRSEEEFIRAIDCCFPYNDADRATALVDEACEISPNAVFMVVHELARVPRGQNVDDATRFTLLDRLEARFDHPLKLPVFQVARRMMRDEYLSTDDCLELMRTIAVYRHQSNALLIVYFSCEESGMDAANDLCDEIDEQWRRTY